MCQECGCGEHTALVCPECGGRVILIDEKPKCLSCGASPSMEEASAAHAHHHHHTEHAQMEDDEQVDSGARAELLTKLSVLLPHWIEHNADHAESFCTWAEQARAAGEEHLAIHIEEAACRIDAANRDLQGAIEHIDADTHEHHHLEHDHPHAH